MLAQNATRIKLLKIWELLCQETDEEHPMESTAIIEKLNDMGIPCNRKTLYSDIQVLCDCGYEVLHQRGRKNSYYVLDRSFDLPELHILLDAVQAASFITEKKSAELIEKIASLAGSRSGEVLKRNIVAFNTTKNTNESIYYSVNEITLAITQGRKLSFTYFDYDGAHQRVYRKDGQIYKVNPFATVFSNDNYYLICYDDKHNDMMHYRVDRMDQVTMLSDKSLPLPKGSRFNVKKHKKQLFGMFIGEEEKVKFEVDKTLLDVVYDKFGRDIKFSAKDDNTYVFSADIQVSPIFYGWCCAFGDKLKVVSPDNVVLGIKEHINQLKENYDKGDRQ